MKCIGGVCVLVVYVGGVCVYWWCACVFRDASNMPA